MADIITLGSFRKSCHLSQEMMARFLRTTRSQVAMAEKGERPLSEFSMERFNMLVNYTKDHPVVQETPDTNQQAYRQLKKSWTKILLAKKWEQYGLIKRLSQLRTANEGILSSGNGVSALVSVLKQHDAARQEIAFFEDKLNDINKKLSTTSKVNQLKLAVAIDLLAAAAGVLTKHIEGMAIPK